MNKHLTRFLGAGALSLAAMGTSMPASAVEVAALQFACPPSSEFTECYTGAVVSNGADTMFSDLDIGTFTLDAMADVLGSFHTKWLKLTSLTLSNSDTSFTSTGKHGDFSFDDLAGGTYTVSISGMLKHPDRFPQMFGHDDFKFRAGIYGGGLGVTPGVVPQVPEPETYALLLAGLLTISLLARRRSPQR